MEDDGDIVGRIEDLESIVDGLLEAQDLFDEFAAQRWAGRRWAGRRWSGRRWSGRRWAGRRWGTDTPEEN